MTHINCGHGCRNRMKNSIKQKYKNITRVIILLYLQLSEICYKVYDHPKKGLVVSQFYLKPLIPTHQVALVDMQSNKNRNFKFTLVYPGLADWHH